MTTGFDKRHERGSDDPITIRSLAVTVDDVVTALEAHQRADRPTVLRVTSPFAPRMRARLHLVGGEGEYDDAAPLHIHPAAFVAPEVTSVPLVDETEDELRERDDYSVERHREYHEEAVDAWRDAVRDGLVDHLELETEAGNHTVDVKYLGRSPESAGE